MGRNKPGTPGYSTPTAQRKHPPLNLSLSEEASSSLAKLAKIRGKSRSKIVEDALWNYKLTLEFAENHLETSESKQSTDESK